MPFPRIDLQFDDLFFCCRNAATGLELTPPFSDGAPDAGTHIRNLMFRLGLSSQEMVALIGGMRTIGRVYKDKSYVLNAFAWLFLSWKSGRLLTSCCPVLCL